MAFIKFKRKLPQSDTQTVVNADLIAWAQPDSDTVVLLRFEDGSDMKVYGTLDEVLQRLSRSAE